MGHELRTPVHVLMVSFPGQGHINPLLRLGKRLASKGLFVTFSAPENIGRDMREANGIADNKATPIGDGFLQFEFFEDGLAPDDPIRKDLSAYIEQLERVGKEMLALIIKNHSETNNPISCIINNPFIPWVNDVAAEFGIPSAVLWVQSCAVFSAYYHAYHKLVPFPSQTEPYLDVKLPSMPILKYNEIPDFLHPSSPFPFLGTVLFGQFKNLSKPFCILMDTFHELEHDVIDYLSKFLPIKPVGPLFKSPKVPNKVVDDNHVLRGDLLRADDCIEWLNSKPPESVIYISFGSIVYLPQEQVDEIAHALVNSGVSFLWVLKPPHRDVGFKPHDLPDGFRERTEGRGRVVQWSPQEEVLSHPSVSCFVTHCGWNSSVESLSLGVPVVTFPAWGDQMTNSKFLVEVFGVGVKLGHGQAANKLVTRDDVEKCLLDATVGPKAEELKKNAMKWKNAAEAAVEEGGSSNRHLEAFVEDIKKKRHTGVNIN